MFAWRHPIRRFHVKQALLRIVRTTAFRLSLVYLVVFAVLTFFMIGYVSRSTTDLLTRQLRETIEAEVRELQQENEEGGLGRLVDVVESRSRVPGASLYLVSDFAGNVVAGNVAELPPAVMDDTDSPVHPIRYQRLGRQRGEQHVALVRVFALDRGFRVLVGRDVGEREQFRDIFRQAFRAIIIVMVVMGLVTWMFVSRRVLKRIDQVSDASRRIVAGDLSGRLPVSGSGDEFDRLALSLNDMLARIDGLMRGVKEVSDNIAHDLKTPLTRMRNRVEAALGAEPDLARYREALDTTIEECDGLIRTFDALLLITRVETGSQRSAMEEIDAEALVREVAELYEPVAEDQGVALSVETVPARVAGNRELLAQALANLTDNALKYGRAEGRTPRILIRVATEGDGVVLSVADNGPGIAAEDRERVLGRFVRLEASRSEPGSGLGLSLVSAIAHLHRSELQLGDAAPGLVAGLRLPRL